MATAIKEVVDNFQVVLTLTKDEAQLLSDVTHRIAGSPTNSDRMHADNINEALRKIVPPRIHNSCIIDKYMMGCKNWGTY